MSWAWSMSEENWDGGDVADTREEAIAEGRATFEGEDFYVGRVVGGAALVERVARGVSFNCVVEDVGIAAFDLVGDHADGWPDCTDEQEADLEARLRATLAAWINETCSPSWFCVEDIERVEGVA